MFSINEGEMKVIKSNSINFSMFGFEEDQTEKESQYDAQAQNENGVEDSTQESSAQSNSDNVGNIDTPTETQQVAQETSQASDESPTQLAKQVVEDESTKLLANPEVKDVPVEKAETPEVIKKASSIKDRISETKLPEKAGKVTNTVVSNALLATKNAGISAAEAIGAKGLAQDLHKGITPHTTGNKVGKWVEENPGKSALIGAAALAGIGYGAKKLLSSTKVQSDAYYAFAPGLEITKDSMIGGPYATRTDARKANPDAGNILKGSTLEAYGDFKVA